MELYRQNPDSYLAVIRSTELLTLPAILQLGFQLLRADGCLFVQELSQALVHTIITVALARSISDDSFVAAGLQRLGDIFIMTDNDFTSAKACYQMTMEVMRNAGARRHVADCVLRFGIVLLLEGKVAEAKQKLMNSRRIYKLAEDPQGYNYCEAILAECEIDCPKVTLTTIH